MVPVYVLCGAVDTIVEGHKTVYAGVGDCEFKSAAGGILYAHFQTPEGKGDRARMMLSGGTLDLARFNGIAIPMMAIINPRMVGKTVFYFDSVDDKSSVNKQARPSDADLFRNQLRMWRASGGATIDRMIGLESIAGPHERQHEVQVFSHRTR